MEKARTITGLTSIMRPVMDKHELTLSVPDAGRRLGLGRNLSYAAARRGELPVLKFGRKLRVPLAALERLLVDPAREHLSKIAS
jgi:excisionase family DNA binding protein